MKLIEGASVLVTPQKATNTCLVVCGGVHGNEPVGPTAISTLVQLISSGQWHIEGAVYSLIGNLRARELGVRFTEENLNRVFLNRGRPDSYESKRAQEITGWFKELAAEYSQMYLLDLHSVSVGDTRIAIFNSEDGVANPWIDTISRIPFRLALRPGALPGALIDGFESLGGCAMVVECGNHVSEQGEIVALEHIENALIMLNMMQPTHPSFRGVVDFRGESRTYEIESVIKPRKGFAWDMPVESEMFLAEGQQYAHDDYGPHVAVKSCYILMPTAVPEPTDFDAGFLAIRTR